MPSEYSTIQAALNAASSGDTIIVADGTYSGSGNYNLDFSGKILSLVSANGADYCTIDADDNGRVFWFHSGETAYSCVDGFRIINGSATEGGAVLLEQNSDPTIRNCVFSGNDATDGHGGAIYASAAKPSIYNCVFLNNSASDRGGAIYGVGYTGMMVHAASTGIRNCSFLGNSADRGGGIAFGVNPMLVVNCSFSGNHATTSGGGLYVHPSFDPGLNVYDCTIVGNSTDGTGGGVYYNGNYGTLLLENSILWDNTDSEITDPQQLTAQIAIANGSAIVNYSCVEQGWSGDGSHNIDDNPSFMDADGADNTVGTIDDDLRLSETSPCIDAADNTAVPNDVGDLDGDGITNEPFPIDLDGFIRFADDPDTEDTGSCGIPCELSIVDMGAYEFGDCNHNGVPDELDILQGTSVDCNSNSVPDECETDCNSNGIPDDCEAITPLFLGTADSIGTQCDLILNSGDSEPRTGGIRQLNFHFECPPSGSPTVYEAQCVSCSSYPAQCAAIWVPYSGSSVMNCTPNDLDLECVFDPALEDQTRYQFDFTGIAYNDPVWEVRALSSDVNNNGVIDGNDIDLVTQASSPECHLDINEDGFMTYADEMVFWGTWGNCAPSSCDPDCNENGVSDVSDIAGGTSIDTNTNGIPDECEPAPPVIESAVSIKEHGPFPPVAYGIDADGVECRLGGISKVKMSFDKIAYSEDGNDFVAGDFTLSRGTVQSINTVWEDQFRPPVAYIELTISGVTTIGQFTIGFTAENDDEVEDSYEVCWTYILADVNSDGAVDDADEASLIAVNRGNLPSVFWYDLDLDGIIESGSKNHDDLDIWSSVAPVSTQPLCTD